MGIKNVNLTPDPPNINSDLSVELEGFTDKVNQFLKFYLKYLSLYTCLSYDYRCM